MPPLLTLKSVISVLSFGCPWTSLLQKQPLFWGKKRLGETGVFSMIIGLILWGKTEKMCVLGGGGNKLVTLPHAVDERMFLSSGLRFQRLKTGFSRLS